MGRITITIETDCGDRVAPVTDGEVVQTDTPEHHELTPHTTGQPHVEGEFEDEIDDE